MTSALKDPPSAPAKAPKTPAGPAGPRDPRDPRDPREAVAGRIKSLEEEQRELVEYQQLEPGARPGWHVRTQGEPMRGKHGEVPTRHHVHICIRVYIYIYIYIYIYVCIYIYIW